MTKRQRELLQAYANDVEGRTSEQELQNGNTFS